MFVLLLFALQDADALKTAIHEHEPGKARAAVDALVKADDARSVDLLVSGLGWAIQAEEDAEKKNRDVQAQVGKDLETLEKKGNGLGKLAALDTLKKNKEKIEAAARSVSDAAEVRDIIEQSFSRFSGDKAVRALGKALSSSGDTVPRSAVARGLGKIEATSILLDQLKRERDPAVKVAILDALRMKRPASKETIEALGHELKSDVWQVQAAAIGALKALKAREAIEPMIDLLAKADGRLKSDLLAALVSITGVDKGQLAEAWRAWFEQNREAVMKGEYTARGDEKPPGQAGMTTFFGIPITSKRIVFVLDCSKSMEGKADYEVSTESGPGIPPELRPAGDRKIDAARYQLKKVLYQLPDDVKFTIIGFHRGSELFKPDLVPLTRENRDQAVRWIDGFELKLGTNIFDSLERALEMGMKTKRDAADTIFFLTDGMPALGKFTKPLEIEREIRRLNAVARMAIHIVYTPDSAMPTPRAESMCRTLTSESGGTLVILKRK